MGNRPPKATDLKDNNIDKDVNNDQINPIDQSINQTISTQNKTTFIIIEYWFRTSCSENKNDNTDIWNVINMYKQWDEIENIMQHLLIRQKVLVSKKAVFASSAEKLYPLYPNTIFNLENINNLCDQTANILKQEPNIFEIELKENAEECYIIGTLKGQFRDLLYWLHIIDFENKMKLTKNPKILFLRNYVEYHHQQIELVLYLFCLKLKYPQNIFLLRGKREFHTINALYGLRKYCTDKLFSDEVNDGKLMYQKINKVLDKLSYCALINKSIFCVSAGIPAEFMEDQWIEKINKMILDPNGPIINDLCFVELCSSDSNQEQHPMISRMKLFCRKNGIKTIIRGKEYYQDGYKYLVKWGAIDCEVITLHSNLYYNQMFENDASIMKLTLFHFF